MRTAIGQLRVAMENIAPEGGCVCVCVCGVGLMITIEKCLDILMI